MRYTVFLIDNDFTAVEDPCTDLIKLERLEAADAACVAQLALNQGLDVVIRACPEDEPGSENSYSEDG